MSVGLRPCGLQGWAVCEGNCEECATTATTTTDGFWYHGNGKIGGEFHPTKPNDEERYGEYVKVVRCKDCAYYTPEVDDPHKSTCQRLWGGMTECNPDSYCSDGVRKDEVEE